MNLLDDGVVGEADEDGSVKKRKGQSNNFRVVSEVKKVI